MRLSGLFAQTVIRMTGWKVRAPPLNQPNQRVSEIDVASDLKASREFVRTGARIHLTAQIDTLDPLLGHFAGALQHVVGGSQQTRAAVVKLVQ